MKNFQTFFAKIDKDGKIDFYDKTGIVMWLQLLRGKEVDVTIAKDINRRTQRQNNALHLYFQLLADEFEAAGIDARMLFGPEVSIPVTPKMIKDLLWRNTQIATVNKKSTTDLTTTDINKIYEIVNRHIGEKFKIHVPFPNINFDDPIWS